MTEIHTTRRRFLQLASFAALALPGCKPATSTNNPVNLNVTQLLELDPKIAEITTQVTVPNPMQSIIVISDVHYNRQQLDLFPDKEAGVLKLQGQVKATLLRMIEKLKITDVYRDSHDTEAVNNCLASFSYLRRAYADPSFAANLNNKAVHSAILTKKNSNDPIEREDAIFFGNILGVQDLVRADAVMGLVYEGKLNLKPTEDPELAKKALNLASSDPNVLLNPEWLALSEQREDYALNQALSSFGTFKVLVFGNSHDFKESVERHNQQHPDQQLNLYSVIPTGQKSFVEQLLKNE